MSPSDLPAAPTLEQRARRRVALKKGLALHALVFLLVNAGLWALALLADMGPQAAGWGRHHGLRLFFPLWGWGLGLTIHAVVVALRLRGEGWTDRLVAREIAALQRREGPDQARDRP